MTYRTGFTVPHHQNIYALKCLMVYLEQLDPSNMKEGQLENKNIKSTSSKRRLFYGWYPVLISWLIAFLLGATAVGIFFKPILDEFGWDRALLSLIGSVVFMMMAILTPFIGQLIDRLGSKTMLIASVISQTLSSTLNGLAGGFWAISIARFLYEIKPTHSSHVLINHWFIKNRGKALAISSTGIPLGTLILSPVSQYLILTWGWRQTLFFWALVTALMLIPLILVLKNKPEEKGLVPDGEVPDLSSDANTHFRSDKNTANAVLSRESKTVEQAIKTRAFWLLSVTHLICGIGCGLMMTHTVIFATDLGYSAMIGATFLSVQGGVNLIGVLFTGPLSDRIARNKALSLTHFVRGISFVVMVIAILFGGGSLWILYPAMALFGFGWFTTAPLMAGLAADLFGYLKMGTIIGIVMSFHMVGMAIGTYAGGLSFSLAHSYLPIFLAQGILELIAAFCAFLIISKRQKCE